MFNIKLILIRSFLVVLSLFIGCQNSKQPSVERFVGNSGTILPLRLNAVTGYRYGYYVDIDVSFIRKEQISPTDKINTPDSLKLHVVLEVGVPTRLATGTYQLYIGKDSFRGTISSPYIYFTGGQGGLPGFGGTFQFQTVKGESYKVYIPPRELKRG